MVYCGSKITSKKEDGRSELQKRKWMELYQQQRGSI